MAMIHRGNRIQVTVRLPYDEYREVVSRARRRGWSMSDYVGWCVAKELLGRANTLRDTPSEGDPLGMKLGDSFGLAQPRALAGAHGTQAVDERFVEVRAVD